MFSIYFNTNFAQVKDLFNLEVDLTNVPPFQLNATSDATDTRD